MIEIGTRVKARTTTEHEQSVVIEVTAVGSEVESGTYVWGYRQVRRGRPRQTSFPREYFVPKAGV